MFFVRAAFWIFLILLLMPTSDKEKSAFYTAASRTLSDVGGFCTRNPDVCDSTGAIFESLVRKMRNTVELLEDMVKPDDDRPSTAMPRHNESEHRRQRGASQDRERERGGNLAPAATRSQNTLRPDDLRPAWRGPGGV